MKKAICIINTGGTIGMKPTGKGLQPVPGFLANQLGQMPELQSSEMPDFEVLEYEPVIDSSNMVPNDWLRITNDIRSRYLDFDGFVVVHGTDTMAYTASALAFLLGDLARPVILTGSQLPLAKVRSDARENLKTAMLIAGNYDVPEVCLLFGDWLLRGCRSTKSSAESFNAFHSPNYHALGRIGTSIEIEAEHLRPPAQSDQPPVAREMDRQEMATIRLFPGMSDAVLANVLQRPLKALIIESYGQGNGPSNDRQFLNTISGAVQDGILVASCSQCAEAFVEQTEYATGRALMDAGVVSGSDMTLEAAIAKIHYLFSNFESLDKIKSLFAQNLVGELTQ